MRNVALSLEDQISVSEQVMERAGLAGRTIMVPDGHADDPEYRRAIAPLERWCSEVTGQGMFRRVYTSDYTLRTNGNPQAMVTSMGAIVLRSQTNEMTVLHECAHIITDTKESRAGHNLTFAKVLHDLYTRFISPAAGAQFWSLMGEAREATLDDWALETASDGLVYRSTKGRLVPYDRTGARQQWGGLTGVTFDVYDSDRNLVAEKVPGLTQAKRVLGFKAEAADSADTQGVMVCLVPDEQTIKVLTDLDECTEPADQAHVTLFYLGSTADVGGLLGRERLYRACYDFAIHAGYESLTGKVNGLGTFSNEDSNVLWAAWDIPGIAEFRASLGGYLREHGVPMRTEDHGFTPHQTLAYTDGPVTKLPRLPSNLPEKVVFGGITISWGDEWQDVKFA